MPRNARPSIISGSPFMKRASFVAKIIKWPGMNDLMTMPRHNCRSAEKGSISKGVDPPTDLKALPNLKPLVILFWVESHGVHITIVGQFSGKVPKRISSHQMSLFRSSHS